VKPRNDNKKSSERECGNVEENAAKKNKQQRHERTWFFGRLRHAIMCAVQDADSSGWRALFT
jgi:hypothetical protein